MNDIDTLIGAELDAAVARALGKKYVEISPDRQRCWAGVNHQDQEGGFFAPSTKWEHGGPLIERENIVFWQEAAEFGGAWFARHGARGARLLDLDAGWIPSDATGPTALIAAMRAFVKSKQK